MRPLWKSFENQKWPCSAQGERTHQVDSVAYLYNKSFGNKCFFNAEIGSSLNRLIAIRNQSEYFANLDEEIAEGKSRLAKVER